MDPQDFGFLDLDPQKYGVTDPDPRGKISTKNYKKNFLLLKPNSELLKKEIIKTSSFLNDSSSFRIKISDKNKTKNLKY